MSQTSGLVSISTIVVTAGFVWEATLAYCGPWVAAIAHRRMLCILSRESLKQPVQPFKGTWCITRRVSSGGTKRGERTGRYLAVVADPSTLPQSMNAVVPLATKNAVDSP